MQTNLDFKQSLKAGLLAAGTAVVVNAVLFYIFHASGIITDTIFIQPDQPLTVVQVVFSSILPTLLASMVFFLFEKYTKKGFRNFTILAIVILLLSFTNPFMMIKGVTTGYALALNFMHIVVVIALFYWINKSVKKLTLQTS